MKKLKITICLFALILIFNACDKEFLDRSPLDQVGSVDYFKSPADLKTYINQFYTSSFFPVFREHGGDYGSDNAITINVNRSLEGTYTLDDAGSISFAYVRSINYFFDNYKKVEENATIEEYQQYLGEAHFFRAAIYFSLLRRYGDIQWFTTTLGTDSPELTKPRDPRNIVADNIIADLDSAAMYLSEDKTDGASRINKWMALLIQSRVAIFEGAWEKYHDGTPFGVNSADPDKYFTKAVEATTAIMNSGLYDIYSTGNTSSDYHDLFILRDYSSTNEVMFWRKFDNILGKGESSFRNQPNHQGEWPYDYTYTKELADSYLCTDGDPISVSPLFQGFASLAAEVQNRDPRFSQTIATEDVPWFIYEDGSIDYWGETVYDWINTSSQYNAPSGYVNRKGYNPLKVYHVPQYEETPGIVFRYGEVLLNFAEAKAELGSISQADINLSIKKLRDRVGMPNLVLANISTDPDWDFPALSPVINEIRRERRIELMAENRRMMDLYRWAAMDELIVGKRPKGFLASQIAVNPNPVDGDGFLDPYQLKLPTGYGFNVNRDYLSAIPKDQLLLNPNLTQNPGWEE
jgi:starch-binding outer membrane protein, SusD/RagB family